MKNSARKKKSILADLENKLMSSTDHPSKVPCTEPEQETGTSAEKPDASGAKRLQDLLHDEVQKNRQNRQTDAAGASVNPNKPESGPKRRKSDAANDSGSSNQVSKNTPDEESGLKQALPNNDPADRQDAVETEAKPVKRRLPNVRPNLDRQHGRKIFKSVVGLLLVIAAGWVPAMRLFQVSSVEAIVNARVVTLRTPIDGTIEFQRDVNSLDTDIITNSLVATITNPRVDRRHVNELQRDLDLAVIQKSQFEAREGILNERRDELLQLTEAYRELRIKTLKTRLDEAKAEKKEIAAQLVVARDQLERSASLLNKQVVSSSKHQEKENEVDVLVAKLERTEAQLNRAALEHDTLVSGGHVGDHFNDMPRSEIDLRQTEQNLQEVRADLEAQTERVASLRQLVAAENEHIDRKEHASILLPVSGRVWEPIVANGEFVNQGQPVLRVLDCSNALVTTAVSEEVYNNLLVGGQATFILRETGEKFSAVIAQLSGVSSKQENLAILPSALEKEPYRATVRVPDIGKGGACLLGKTGRVVFESTG